MTTLALVALALSGLYAGLTGINLWWFRVPGPVRGDADRPAVSVLIPARDEGERIEATLHAVLASRDVTLEVLVLDDDSGDDTAAIVDRLAAADPRLRRIAGAPLPAGWNGKQHACAQLAEAARHALLVFIDADVHLAPDALARSVDWLDRRGLGLASGFPRLPTPTRGEALLVPMIPVLLLGYLPLPLSRLMPRRAFLAAGCGQFLIARRTAYDAAGGHRAIGAHMHDGMKLPARARRAGHATDLFNARPLATCRMYHSLRSAWQGFAKDATEGMATPVGLPVWTVLLVGGHLLAAPVCLIGLAIGAPSVALIALAAGLATLTARLAVARACGQSARAVWLHPAAVCVTLALQWRALWAARRGRPRHWRGRTYG